MTPALCIFVIGDLIIIGEYTGTVDHSGLKTTRIKSLSGEGLVLWSTSADERPYPLQMKGNAMDFSGKTALITGSSRGIGRAVAEAFAKRGARVAVHFNKNRKKAEECLASLEGGPHALVRGDVSDESAARAIMDAAVSELGHVDILVNNAGIYEKHYIAEADFDAWRDFWHRTLFTNLVGAAHLSFWAAKHMIERGGGNMVNITSRGAFRGEPDAPAYGASKAGMNAMSQSLAQALAPHNIFVTAVAPGFVETDMTEHLLEGEAGEAIRSQTPLNRLPKPEDVAELVLFLASDKAEHMTGCIVDINSASYLRT